jgi:hypothetical protein
MACLYTKLITLYRPEEASVLDEKTTLRNRVLVLSILYEKEHEITASC